MRCAAHLILEEKERTKKEKARILSLTPSLVKRKSHFLSVTLFRLRIGDEAAGFANAVFAKRIFTTARTDATAAHTGLVLGLSAECFLFHDSPFFHRAPPQVEHCGGVARWFGNDRLSCALNLDQHQRRSSEGDFVRLRPRGNLLPVFHRRAYFLLQQHRNIR